MLNRYLLFTHILSAITFFLGHGAGAAMAFQIRKETNLDRIRAMLDLSTTTINVYLLAFLLLGVTGLVMLFLLGLWDQVWVWASVALMLLVFFWMYRFTEVNYKVLRKLIGLPYRMGNTNYPAEEPAAGEVIIAHIAGIDLKQLVLVGYILPAFVLWLMIFRPF